MNKQVFIGIQSRLDSKRFSKKALTPIGNIPLIIRVIKRMSQLAFPHQIALLVPLKDVNNYKDIVDQYALDILIFGGCEDNVLDRYYQASVYFNQQNNLIMRVTGDNPLISIPLAELLIQHHLHTQCDLSHFINNPLGTGVEIISFSALKKSYQEATTNHEREHVTPYIYANPNLFHIEEPISPYINKSYQHLSVDYPQDIDTIEQLLQTNPNWDISLYSQ